ncbi:MAG: hypothetical protein ABI741_02255 [Ferruginibacter sp.]
MTIAVHISFPGTKDDPSKNFNYRCFTILAEKYPACHFIFIFDKPFSPLLISQKNIIPVLLTPQIRNRLLGHYWYNFKVPSLLNKYHADLFVSDGINSSLRTSVKQCLVLKDLSFLQKENLFTRSDNSYLKKYFKKFVAKAHHIAVSNQAISVALTGYFPAAKSKTHVIGYGLPEGVTVGFNKMQATRDKYSEGKEFFLCYITEASASNTTILLKAFSAFKKRQLSNMQLVLVIRTAQKENPVKDLATYKYRDEVKIVVPANEESHAEITTAAYAAIYLPAMEIMEEEGLTALKNNIPLITTSNEFCKSLYNDAALYAKIDEKNIAEKMMLLYKNENLKNDLANIGKLVGSIYSWDKTAANLWQALQETAEQ